MAFDTSTLCRPSLAGYRDVYQHAWQLPWSAHSKSAAAWRTNIQFGRGGPCTDSDPTLAPRMKRRKTRESTYRPFDRCCIEIVERVLSFVPLEDKLVLKRLNRSFNTILSSPHMYPCIRLVALPIPPQALLDMLPSLLPGTRSLSLRSFPRAQLKPILASIPPNKLVSLDLSFSVITDEALSDLANSGALEHVRHLHLKGCRGVRDGAWLSTALPNVETLDLSWSGIDSLPESMDAVTITKSSGSDSVESPFIVNPDDSGFFDLVPVKNSPPWPRLRRLCLSSLPYLPRASLLSFVASLPARLEFLDLSHLGLGTRDVRALCSGWATCPALETVDVSGNDGLTLSCIEQLRRPTPHGDTTQRAIRVVHTAVLESEAEEHVRRFVQMVAGVMSRS